MILALIPLVIGLLGGAMYGVWLSHVEAQAERKKFQRVMQATEKPWTPPCFSQKASKGFQQRRQG